MVDVGVSPVWSDAWEVYKLLFRRSVLLAALIYAAIEGVYRFAFASDDFWTIVALGIVAVILLFAGPVLVQGALVEIVRNVHEARRPETVSTLLRLALRRFHSLFWASIVYGIGVVVGLLLLIVPGLLVASRWSLMAPLIMLERKSAGEAWEDSRELVKPYTWSVLGVIVLTFITTTIVSGIFDRVEDPLWLGWTLSVASSALTVPFYAHVLSVLYYRITDPENEVVHPDVRTWQSVWEGA